MSANGRQCIEWRVASSIVFATLLCVSIVAFAMWFLMSMQFGETADIAHSTPVLFYIHVYNAIWAPIVGFCVYGAWVLRHNRVTLFSVVVYLAVTGIAMIAWLLFTALVLYADMNPI